MGREETRQSIKSTQTKIDDMRRKLDGGEVHDAHAFAADFISVLGGMRLLLTSVIIYRLLEDKEVTIELAHLHKTTNELHDRIINQRIHQIITRHRVLSKIPERKQ